MKVAGILEKLNKDGSVTLTIRSGARRTGKEVYRVEYWRNREPGAIERPEILPSAERAWDTAMHWAKENGWALVCQECYGTKGVMETISGKYPNYSYGLRCQKCLGLEVGE